MKLLYGLSNVGCVGAVPFDGGIFAHKAHPGLARNSIASAPLYSCSSVVHQHLVYYNMSRHGPVNVKIVVLPTVVVLYIADKSTIYSHV